MSKRDKNTDGIVEIIKLAFGVRPAKEVMAEINLTLPCLRRHGNDFEGNIPIGAIVGLNKAAGILGSLIELGNMKIEPEEITDILESLDSLRTDVIMGAEGIFAFLEIQKGIEITIEKIKAGIEKS